MKKQDLKKWGLMGTLFATSLCVQAIEPPTGVAPETLVAGGKYVLTNPANPTGYHSRTSWDGALYFLGMTDSNFANHAIEAVQNEDGTWSFIQTATDGSVKYMLLPEGSANINMGDSAVWEVEKGAIDGHYYLRAGNGNNSNAVGLYMHLNAGQQYFVVSYSGGPWYPDYAVKTDELGNQLLDEVTGNFHMADSTSLNWGFVSVENMQSYVAKQNAYNTIAGYDTTYCVMPEYGTGFEVACKAAKEMYENEAFDGAMAEALLAILNSKIALYEEIEKAIAKNVDGNATLGNAIQAAIEVFDASAKADEMNASVEALQAAMAAYEQGLGDYTSMGQNMSFEDLSAQGGSMTTSVGNAPAGWNLYINGVLCQTADELRAAGIAAWCGVNDDCAGEAKDGLYGFGIWNQGMPAVELSQTITGIENGTYEISAALMVGANGSGSRRTTQRIFGNLNSIYFASQPEYDQSRLDNSEVYTFADLVEPVTDRDMQEIIVRAYVYDGTLTFGLRTDGNVAAANRTSGNGAGGDGWFKVDNFRIRKVGFQISDAWNVMSNYEKVIEGYALAEQPCYSVVQDKLVDFWMKFSEIGADATEEQLNAMILESVAMIEEVKPYVSAYTELNAALQAAYIGLDEYGNMPGAVTFATIVSEVEADYNGGVYDIAGVEAAIARLENALEDCKKSEITPGQDITNLIVNPSFEDMSSQPGGDTGGLADAPKGWTLILDGDTCRTMSEISAHGIANWCAINSGDAIAVSTVPGDTIRQQPTDGTKLWGIWTPNIPEVELSQTITGLPIGTYTLTVDVMVENNWAGDNITTQRIFGNEFVQMFSAFDTHEVNLPADAVAAEQIDLQYPELDYAHLSYADYACESIDPTTSLLRPMKVTFCVGNDNIARIGFRTNGITPTGENGVNGRGWFKVDNFRLTYVSTQVSTGIEEVLQGNSEVVGRQFFTIDGVQIAAPQKGVTIVKETLANGQVRVSKLMK